MFVAWTSVDVAEGDVGEGPSNSVRSCFLLHGPRYSWELRQICMKDLWST